MNKIYIFTLLVFALCLIVHIEEAHAQILAEDQFRYRPGHATNPMDSGIGILREGNLVIEPARGGMARLATPTEKDAWHKVMEQVDVFSPGLQWVAVISETGSDKAVDIVRVADNSVFLKDAQIQASARYPHVGRVRFASWLPDGEHILVVGSAVTGSAFPYTRSVIEIHTGTVIAFNGWMAPNRKLAIVPGVDGKIGEQLPAEGAAQASQPGAMSKLGYFIVQMPADIAQYHFTEVEHKPLLLEGKPFAFSDPHPSFSPDSKWMLCNGKYLIEMATGRVRSLAGTNARFIVPTPAIRQQDLQALSQLSPPDQNRLTGAGMSQEVAFLLRLPSPATFAQVRARLPQGVKVPFNEQEARVTPSERGTGTEVGLKGTVTGLMMFLNAEQKREVSKQSDHQNSQILKYHRSDPLAQIDLVIDNAKEPELPDGKRRLQTLINLLGRPQRLIWADPEHTDHVYGIQARWIFQDGRVLDFIANLDGTPILSLQFSYAYIPTFGGMETN